MESNERNLDLVQVAKNCPASWNKMCGTDRVRHCTHCNRKVYNLSNMTREEAEQVVFDTEGHVCIRFYRRGDGKVMTRDCGRAVRARVKLKVAVSGILSMFGFATVAFPVMGAKPSPEFMVKQYTKSLRRIHDQLKEAQSPEDRQRLVEKEKVIREDLKHLMAKL